MLIFECMQLFMKAVVSEMSLEFFIVGVKGESYSFSIQIQWRVQGPEINYLCYVLQILYANYNNHVEHLPEKFSYC